MAEKKNSARVPMMGPDGHIYDISPDQVGDAILHGGKLVKLMQAPPEAGGGQHWVSVDQVEEGLKNGGSLLQNDGTPYPDGEAPAIVGHNSAGQPIWGVKPPEKEGFLKSAGEAIGGVVKGALQLVDPRATEEEKAAGLTTPYDYALRPFERMAEGQVAEGQRSVDAARAGHYSEAAGHGLAALIPGAGPMAANAGEKIGEQVGEGDYGGAAGTLAGNAAVMAAPEVLPPLARGALKGRIAEFQAPAAELDKPIAAGDLTPRQRFIAATKMRVNLDRAQATNAAGPGMAKRVTEQSLGGRGTFEKNSIANQEALQKHAEKVLNWTAPELTRREFGEQMQAALKNHRDNLVGLPRQKAAAQALLDMIANRSMTGEEFGAEAQHALQQHLDSIYSRAGKYLTDALARKGTSPAMGNLADTADRIYEEEKDYFKEHPEALKIPGVQRIWDDWVKRYSPKAAEEAGKKPANISSISNAVKLRSDMQKLYESPELVGSRPEGWLKQMVAAVDDGITDPANENGMTPAEIQKFRAGNSLWKRMKSMYDDPQSPFFSILRSNEPKTVAGTLEKLKPSAARQFREAMGDVKRGDLVAQQQRQVVNHLLDPSENGEFDLTGLGGRWEKIPKEQATEMLGANHVNAIGNLADWTKQTTPYDVSGSQLGKIIHAPDGTSAAEAMFDSSGRLKLTPEEVEQVEQGAPELMPQFRRQVMHRLLDPKNSGTFDLRNLPSRWNRTEKSAAGAVLVPSDLQSMDELASVSRAVHADANPSGTAKTLQPYYEASGIGGGVVGGGAAMLSGHPLVGAAAMAVPVGTAALERLAARRMVDPEATAAIMEHEAAPSAPELARSAVDAVKSAPGKVAEAARSGDLSVSPRRAATSAAAGAAETLGTNTDRDRFKQMTQQRREGVSTPPNGGQVTSTTEAEPNEVHNAAAATAELERMQKQEGHDARPLGAPAAQPAGLKPADLYTGGSSGVAEPGGRPQASVEIPEGATHEVLHPDTQDVIGHVVDGEYVPLQQAYS